MPHIRPERRAHFDAELDAFPVFACKGDLTYAINRLQMRFLEQVDDHYEGLSDAVAAANDANDEFREHIMRPYEALAAARNGNIFAIYLRTERTLPAPFDA